MVCGSLKSRGFGDGCARQWFLWFRPNAGLCKSVSENQLGWISMNPASRVGVMKSRRSPAQRAPKSRWLYISQQLSGTNILSGLSESMSDFLK